jgi:hypothetical protein
MAKKPLIFESACVFSIIGSSIGFIMMFTATFFFRFVTEKISMVTNITATEKLSPFYFAFLMAAFTVSLVGVIKLYRMQRGGLFLYLPAQLIILFLPVIWLGDNAFSVTNAIFTLIFSSVYLWYFPRLNKFKG